MGLNRVRQPLLFLPGLLFAATALSTDVYVVRFNTVATPALADSCTYFSYRDELIFYNGMASVGTVYLRGVSNGDAADPRVLTIERNAALSSETGIAQTPISTWKPAVDTPLWVAHLDVPEGVLVVSRLLVPTSPTLPCSHPFQHGSTYAGIAMPVVRQLTPAGVPQVHVGIDVGGDPVGAPQDGRTNIGIYNGGSVAATAVVDIHRGCDAFLIDSRSSIIPPNTVVQLNGFSTVASSADCHSYERLPTFEKYAVVTVDQPSFSYAITLSNNRPPWIPVSSSP